MSKLVIFLIIAFGISCQLFTTSMGSQEFQVFRMHQFDMQGAKFGSQATGINNEARTLRSKFLSRKSVIVKINELTIETYRYLITQNVNSIIIGLSKTYNQTEKEVS